MKNKPANLALRVCVIYTVVGGLWILLSGRLLFVLVSNPDMRLEIEIYKGWGFIAITALSLYVLLRSQLRRMEGETMERRQTEEVLLEKTALLEAQINSSIEGILVVDNEGRKVIQNQRTIDLWKIPQDIAHNTDDEKQVQFVTNQTKNPEQFVEKVIYLYSHPDEISRDEVELKDGTILDRYSSPVVGKDGKRYGRIWSFRDITERKRAEEALKQSEGRLHQVMRSTRCILNYGEVEAPEGWRERAMQELTIFRWDFPVMNEEAAQEVLPLDVPPGKTYQHVWSEHRNPDDFKAMHKVAREAFQNNAPFYRNEFRCTDKHGVEHWMQEFITIHKLGENHWEIFGINTDITDLKKSEDALRESEAKFRSYVENAPMAVLVADKHGRLTDCNQAAAELLDYDVGALSSISIKDLHPEEDAQKILESFRTLAAKRHIEGEYRFKRRDGTLIWVSLRAVLTGSGLAIAFCQDITEHRKTAEAIANERQLLRTLIDLLPDTFYVKDLDSRFLIANSALAKHFGKEFPSEIVGHSDADFFPPELAAEYRAAELKVLGGEPLVDHEGNGIGPNGQKCTHLTTKVPFRDSQGRVQGLVGIGRDITERKRAEETFAAQQKLLDNLIAAVPDLVYFKDRESRFIRINEAYAKRAGLNDVKSAIGKTDFDIFGEAHARQAYEDEQRILSTGQPIINKEEREDWPDGRVTWAISTKMPLLDSGGKTIGTMGISRDITERKQSEESHQRLATVVEQATEAVVITDIDGKILYVNPAFEAVTGYSQKEVTGRNPRFLKSGNHDDTFYKRMWTVLANGEVWSGRLVNKRKDGTLFEEEATISPVRDSNGRITNYVAVKRDVTREVMLENQFRQSQKMEAFGQLAGGVAHDFNNLLTVIQGSASLLLNPQLNSEERSSCSRQIVQAAERAAGLTRQLLMFSRKHALQVVTVNLNEIVGNMTKMLQRILGEDIVLRAEYDPKIAAISADAGMMEQVLLNLAVNSRDAMPKGGQLLIATSQQKLGANHPQLPADIEPGTYVCLKVTDTGCGIAPAVLPHIFEPFFTTKETGKGTGLGLATVYGIVQQHHGWITAKSEPGQGATFCVFLPAAAGTPVKPETTTLVRLPRGTETILLTEDEPAVRVLASNILRRCGYTILSAESGIAALEIWREYRDKIQMLLTDIIMPDGITGYDLAQQLQSERPQLKVIYTSGYTGDILSRYPTLIHDHPFLQKPYQPYQLAQTVRDCLDQDPVNHESGNGG